MSSWTPHYLPHVACSSLFSFSIQSQLVEPSPSFIPDHSEILRIDHICGIMYILTTTNLSTPPGNPSVVQPNDVVTRAQNDLLLNPPNLSHNTARSKPL